MIPAPPLIPGLAQPPDCCGGLSCSYTFYATCVPEAGWQLVDMVDAFCITDCVTTDWAGSASDQSRTICVGSCEVDGDCSSAPDPGLPIDPPCTTPPPTLFCVAQWTVTCEFPGATWPAPELQPTGCTADCTPVAWTEVIPNNSWYTIDCADGGCVAEGQSPCPLEPATPPPGYPTIGGSCTTYPEFVTISIPTVDVPSGCPGGPSSWSDTPVIMMNCGGGCYQQVYPDTPAPGEFINVLLQYAFGQWTLRVTISGGGTTVYIWTGSATLFDPTGSYTFSSSSSGCGTPSTPGSASVS